MRKSYALETRNAPKSDKNQQPAVWYSACVAVGQPSIAADGPRALGQCRLDALARERDGTQPLPCRVEDRVRERRGHRRRRRFAGAKRRFLLPQHEVDLDVGNVREGENRIARPVDTRHARAIEDDLFEQRARQRLQNAAFDLLRQCVGIDDEAAVVRTADANDADRTARACDSRICVSLDRNATMETDFGGENVKS